MIYISVPNTISQKVSWFKIHRDLCTELFQYTKEVSTWDVDKHKYYDTADILLVIPPVLNCYSLPKIDSSTYLVEIGKGMYDEIKNFKGRYVVFYFPNSEPNFVIYRTDTIQETLKLKLDGKNWKHYGTFTITNYEKHKVDNKKIVFTFKQKSENIDETFTERAIKVFNTNKLKSVQIHLCLRRKYK